MTITSKHCALFIKAAYSKYYVSLTSKLMAVSHAGLVMVEALLMKSFNLGQPLMRHININNFVLED